MVIDRTELALLLERNKEKIGHNRCEGADVVTNALAFLFSTAFSSFDEYGIALGIIIKATALLVGVGFLLHGIIKIKKSRATKYGSEQLMKDINQLDKTEHKFSLIAIKDTFHAHPNRFLTCYNEKWKCWMFPYFKTQDNESENITFIQNGIANQLKVDVAEIKATFIAFDCRSKTNPETGIRKQYAHRLYSVSVSVPESAQSSEFEIDGTKYRWMSISEMCADPEIRSKNLDAVSLVQDNIA